MVRPLDSSVFIWEVRRVFLNEVKGQGAAGAVKDQFTQGEAKQNYHVLCCGKN